MTLDSWLVARLARELHGLLGGARIQAVQASAGGIILSCYRRGTVFALHAIVDSNAPLVAGYEYGEPQKENGAGGWAGPVAALLRGCTVDAVHAVPNDRVLYVNVSSRSAFGLPSLSRLVIELQPRKANALVLRPGSNDEWIIVAAAKQFEGSGDARNVTIGAQYEAPPQQRPRVDRAQFILLSIGEADGDRLARLLGEFDPACTPPLAREAVARTADKAATGGRAHALLDAWASLRREVELALEKFGEVYVYRCASEVRVCHLIPLTWPAVEASTSRSVNDVCVAQLHERSTQLRGPALDSLRKKLATLLSRCNEESAGLERARSAAQQADRLRQAGDAIYAHLSEIASGATEFAPTDGPAIILNPLISAKENAADYFRRYKKARSGLPRIEARLRALRLNRQYWEQLQWELERAEALPAAESGPLIAEISDALGIKPPHKRAQRARPLERKVELSGGAVAYVGRSPKENERLTFFVAGPNDYWFHARGVPGAHVIVKTDGSQITPKQIEEAAALAAGYSRAAESLRVEVDYTRRKHVRRHSAGRPGLVWYTDSQTIRVAPRSRNV